MKKEKEDKSLDFAYKEPTLQGIFSCSLFGISLVILIVSLIFSWNDNGEGGIFLGIAGIFALLLCVIGSYMGYRAVKRKGRVEKRSAWFGLIANGIFVAAWLGLYVWGYMVLMRLVGG